MQLIVAFAYRIADLASQDPEKSASYRYTSFQILACAGPLIWSKILTI